MSQKEEKRGKGLGRAKPSVNLSPWSRVIKSDESEKEVIDSNKPEMGQNADEVRSIQEPDTEETCQSASGVEAVEDGIDSNIFQDAEEVQSVQEPDTEETCQSASGVEAVEADKTDYTTAVVEEITPEEQTTIQEESSTDEQAGDLEAEGAACSLNPDAEEFVPLNFSDFKTNPDNQVLPQVYVHLHHVFSSLERHPQLHKQIIEDSVDLFTAIVSTPYIIQKITDWIVDAAFANLYENMALNGARFVARLTKMVYACREIVQIDTFFRNRYLNRLSQEFTNALEKKDDETEPIEKMFVLFNLISEAYILFLVDREKSVRINILADALVRLAEAITFHKFSDTYTRTKKFTTLLKLVGPYLEQSHPDKSDCLMRLLQRFIETCNPDSDQKSITLVQSIVKQQSGLWRQQSPSESADSKSESEESASVAEENASVAAGYTSDSAENASELQASLVDEQDTVVHNEWDFLDLEDFYVREDGSVGIDEAIFALSNRGSQGPREIEEDPNWDSELEDAFEEFLEFQNNP